MSETEGSLRAGGCDPATPHTSLADLVAFVSLRSWRGWAWPPGSTRWWRCTRPAGTTSCCACSAGSWAPTRTAWASWWAPWWTTSRGQFAQPRHGGPDQSLRFSIELNINYHYTHVCMWKGWRVSLGGTWTTERAPGDDVNHSNTITVFSLVKNQTPL